MDVMKSIDELFLQTDGKSYQDWLSKYLKFNEEDPERPWAYGILGFFCFVDLEALA